MFFASRLTERKMEPCPQDYETCIVLQGNFEVSVLWRRRWRSRCVSFPQHYHNDYGYDDDHRDSTINVRLGKQREDARLNRRNGALTLSLTIRNRNRKGLTGQCAINQIARLIEGLTASDERLSGVEGDGE